MTLLPRTSFLYIDSRAIARVFEMGGGGHYCEGTSLVGGVWEYPITLFSALVTRYVSEKP